ncbi:MAG: type I-D CRISPR-associated helicase Cas3', partial [Candidatus Nanohaloarchaea archaeon]
MIVKEAYLEKVEPEYDFSKDFNPRRFQNEFLKWIYEGEEQFCLMKAPTGAGKTAAFTELCKKPGKTLLIYPTNALIEQQEKRMKEELSEKQVKVLNSETLEGTGYQRTMRLKQQTEFHTADVILTNPDILQALVQGKFIDPSGESMEFFNNVQSVVYDEFHFYDDFASSGLIMQSKIFFERNKNRDNPPRIVFCSATPNEEYIETIKSSISDDIRFIESEYQENGDKFRAEVKVKKDGDYLTSDSNKEKALEIIKEKLDNLKDPNEHKIAVIFNSAYRSNEFYDFLNEELDSGQVTKDNGYDTKSEIDPDESAPVLVTTSKSEIGLDYDIQLMLMENPKDAASFIQRFGRAGRKSKAEVHLFRFGYAPSWWKDGEEEIDFSKFEKRIYETIDSDNSSSERIEEFVGMRSAKAVLDRENKAKPNSKYDEIYEDFADSPNYGKWKKFLKNLKSAQESEDEEDFFGSTGKTPEVQRAIGFLKECSEALGTLRGRSLTYDIKYPRGDEMVITNYQLLSVLQNYQIKKIKDELIHVRPKKDDQTNLKVSFKSYSNIWENWESLSQAEHDIFEKKKSRIRQSDLEEQTKISKVLAIDFLRKLKITRAAVPEKISYGAYKLKVEQDGSEIN